MVLPLCLLTRVDIDECQRNTHNCNVNATCTNTPGSFFCTCNPGYTGDGVVRCDGKKFVCFGGEEFTATCT